MERTQKENKKQKDYHKLEKLQKPGIALQQLLQQDPIVQMFRTNNIHLNNYLKLNHYRQMIEYVTVLGREDDKLRGFKYPQVSCEILSSQIPKVWEIMFTVVEQENPHVLLLELLKYFDEQPNYTLSGYVMKILNSLYFYEPVRVQQILIQSKTIYKMLGFLSSRSVSQFLIKVIIVENETILTLFFKQRKDLFEQLISLYDKNQRQEEYMSQVAFVLCEIMNKLWGSKHKELGRFSQSLLQLIEIIIGKQKLCNQQSLMLVVIKHLSNYLVDAPFLIKAILSKSYKEVSSNSFDTLKSTLKTPITKFGAKKLKLLQCLSTGFGSCISLVQSLSNIHVYFSTFLNLIVKHEWNNLMHVEVETIFRQTFKSGSQELFKAMFQKGRFGEIVKDLIKKQERKQVKGYIGTFINIVSSMNQGVIKQTQFGKFLKRQQPNLVKIIQEFLKVRQTLYVFNLSGYSVNNKPPVPQYDQQFLLEKHKDFLDIANQTLTARQLIKSISSTNDSQISQTLTNEIEDQGVLNSKFYQQQSSSPQKSTTV